MPQRIAKVAQVYADRQIKVGEAFEVEPQHVELLLALGRIKPEPDQASAATYGTRDMTAQRGKRAHNRKAA